MAIKRLMTVIFLLGSFSFGALAAPNCGTLLENQVLISQDFVTAQMRRFQTLSPAAQNKLGAQNVEFVLRDEQNPLVRQALVNLIAALSIKPVQGTQTVDDVDRVLRETLTNRVPARQIEERIANLREGQPETLQRALAYRTLAEMQELVYGSDPNNPSPDSLIGQFLKETGASHLMRGYAKGPNANEGVGAPRLTVALNPTNRIVFMKYFDMPEMLMHYHTPSQGTLLIYFNGMKWAYAGSSQSAVTATTFTDEGMLLPLILLSSSEANRMANYISLGMLNQTLAKLPWQLGGYCAIGGYNSCTHWFGEIPLGDPTLKEYSFPGHVDGWASNEVSSTAPQRQELKPYWESPTFRNWINTQGAAQVNNAAGWRNSDAAFGNQLTAERTREVVERLARLVWQVPGHQPMGDMLGEEAAKLRGEFANPGYVACVLTGRVTPTRVPVVFRAQAAPALDPNFPTNISAH